MLAFTARIRLMDRFTQRPEQKGSNINTSRTHLKIPLSCRVQMFNEHFLSDLQEQDNRKKRIVYNQKANNVLQYTCSVRKDIMAFRAQTGSCCLNFYYYYFHFIFFLLFVFSFQFFASSYNVGSQ